MPKNLNQEDDMKTFLLFVTAAILAMLPLTLLVQSGAADQSLTDFAGTWRGICQDGNPFVILTIRVNGGILAGDISIANMQGGNGQCATVTDAPTAEHAMKIDGAKCKATFLVSKVQRRRTSRCHSSTLKRLG